MDILTPFQKKFLKQVAKTDLRESFFLTGGTALSAFFLKHRLSEDLDFFTDEPQQVPQVMPVLQKIVQRIDAKIEVRRQFRTFLEVFIHGPSEQSIKCDFAQDSPFRLQPKVLQNEFDLFTDNALDISCNKLSALFDRTEAKDFVDIFFIAKKLFSFSSLLEQAKQKHIGLDNYWLAISMAKVEELGPLPRMLKPVTIEELQEFFHTTARTLMS